MLCNIAIQKILKRHFQNKKLPNSNTVVFNNKSLAVKTIFIHLTVVFIAIHLFKNSHNCIFLIQFLNIKVTVNIQKVYFDVCNEISNACLNNHLCRIILKIQKNITILSFCKIISKIHDMIISQYTLSY